MSRFCGLIPSFPGFFFLFVCEKIVPLSAFLEHVVLALCRLVRREEQLDGGAGVLRHVAADLVRVDLVRQEVVDLVRRVRTVWKKTRRSLFFSVLLN